MNKGIAGFFSSYTGEVATRAIQLREVILKNLPGVTEMPDLPARMVAYCYGQKYIEMVCTIIPSKKGLKLGFAYGVDLPDPDGLLEGTGKLSRYAVINDEEQIKSAALKKLLSAALLAYKNRIAEVKPQKHRNAEKK
jgi:hypothetical protein